MGIAHYHCGHCHSHFRDFSMPGRRQLRYLLPVAVFSVFVALLLVILDRSLR